MGAFASAINDPTVRSMTYVVAAAVCLGAYVSALSKPEEARGTLWALWIVMAAALVGFAVLRETDLERTLGRHVREFAQERGWYPDRRPAQEFVIAVVSLGATGAALVGSRLVRYPHWQLTFGLMALIYLSAFVTIRAVSLHEVDYYLYDHYWRDIQLAALFEVLGTVAIALAAALAIRPPVRM